MKVVLIIALCLVGASHQGLVGGWKDVGASEEAIQTLAQAAIEHRNSNTDSLYYRNLVQVKSARQQVVNGLKYEVTVVLGETNCVKQDAGAHLCELSQNGFQEECVYVFWKEPTETVANILSSSCTEL